MKKINLITLSFIFTLITLSFISCDVTDSDGGFLGEGVVGKPELTITVKDSTYYRNDVKAYLAADGSISFSIKNLGKAKFKGDLGQDIFDVSLAVFSNGLYPLNADGINKNIAMYQMDSDGVFDFESFSSVNFKAPNTGRSGVFTISNVNFKDNVFSGEFTISMHPGLENTKNTEVLKVVGSFKDLPFERTGIAGNQEFVYLEVDSKPMNDLIITTETVVLELPEIEENVVVDTYSKSYTKVKTKSSAYQFYNLDFSFPEDSPLNVNMETGFTVSYISKNGEKYTNEKSNLQPGSTLRIVSVEKEGGVLKIAGRFNFVLKNNEGTMTTQLSKGDFVIFKDAK